MQLVVKTFIVLMLVSLVLAVLVQWRASAREASVEAEFPPSGRFIDVDGTKIHLNVSGPWPDRIFRIFCMRIRVSNQGYSPL